VLVVVLDVLPLGRLVLVALSPGGQFSPEAALAALTSRSAIRATLATLETGIASSAISFALGAALALAVSATDLRGRRPISFLFVLSLMVAPQVMALAFMTLAGPASPILNLLGLAPMPGSQNPLLGRWGIILVLGLHHAPIVFILLVAGLKRVPLALIEAAQIDGDPPSRILRHIVVPLLRPHLVSAALLAFVAGVGNFGIAALLGLPVNYLTLPTLIYRRLSSFGPSIIGDVAVLGVAVACIAGIGVVASRVVMRGISEEMETERGLEAFWRLGRRRPVVEAVAWSLVVLVLVLPLLSLLAAALVPATGVTLSLSTVTFDNFTEVLLRQGATARAFRNSLLFAGATALTLAVLCIPAAYVLSRRMGRGAGTAFALIEAPYAVPGIVLAVACILLLLKPLPLLNASLYATPGIILFAYLARFLPVALKPAMAAMAQLELAQEEAAALDGAALARRLATIVAPALLPSVAAGALLAFLLAFGELTVSALLWTAGTETVGVVLYSLEEAGLASQAAAIGTVTVLVVAAVMLALEGFGRRLPSGTLPWRP
jgi:iron(III) transport system permease protein